MKAVKGLIKLFFILLPAVLITIKLLTQSYMLQWEVPTENLVNIAELGDGWEPVILETEVEHDFIKQSQRGLTNQDDYFIAGSAYPDVIGPFDYSAPFGFKPQGTPDPAYSPSQSGNMAWRCIWWVGLQYKFFTITVTTKL